MISTDDVVLSFVSASGRNAQLNKIFSLNFTLCTRGHSSSTKDKYSTS